MTSGAARYVVDTNVLVAADQRAGVGPECVSATAAFLEKLSADGTVVVDDAFRIIKEYLANRPARGEAPGVGSEFLAWLLVNQASDRCVKVHLTETAPDEFEEFPGDPDLARFDRADRKFAAAARISQSPVANATDPDWRECKSELSRNGIEVVELCAP